MKEYKVMTQKDRWFGGKFDPDQLEKALNAYAGEGWACKAIATEISRQNATLAEVKAQLAAAVKSCGGTALMGFRYGQKKHDWTQLLSFKWDTESWHGEGDAIVI